MAHGFEHFPPRQTASDPTPENGLRLPSQIMVDKPMTVRRDRLGETFGRLDDGTMLAVNRALALFLDFG